MGRVNWMSLVAATLAFATVISAVLDNFEYANAIGLAAITCAVLSHHNS